MDIIVKVRFNSSKEMFETFGRNKYLIYLPFEKDGSSESMLKTILSKKLGVPIKRIEFKGFDVNQDWSFNLS